VSGHGQDGRFVQLLVDRESGDTNRLWSFKQLRRATCFLGTEGTTDGLFQTIHKRGASKRMTGATVFSKIPQLFFPDRTAQQPTPIGNHRQHRSDSDQSIVAARQVRLCTAPGPIGGIDRQTCSHRIQFHVSRGRLWLSRAAPRAWLAQGQKIAVKNLPTHFGAVEYEIVSDAQHGRIKATVKLPSRKMPNEVWLRLRHPQATPIKSVAVNGQPWARFDREKELVQLDGLQGTVRVLVEY